MIHQPQNIAVWLALPFPTWESVERKLPAGEYAVRRCGEDPTTGFLSWVEVDFRGDFGLEILTVLGDGLLTASGLSLAGVLVRPGYRNALGHISRMETALLMPCLMVLRRDLGLELRKPGDDDLGVGDLRLLCASLLARKYAYPTRPAIKAAR